MSNVTALRTELKQWERDFKTEHGRHPTVEDIKAQPAIASRYKLYKKLSKATPAVSSARDTAHAARTPSPTPDSARPRATQLISKSRAVHTGLSTSSSNPFSPTKEKGKQRAQFNSLLGTGASNPFSTPVKSRPTRTRTESPDPFAADASQPSSASSSSRPLFPPVSSSPPPDEDDALPAQPADRAVVRARKRLRGEPVSPSPNKDKRRRTTGTAERTLSQTALARPKFGIAEVKGRGGALSDSDGGGDEDAVLPDSPVKGETGKFKSLFEEPVLPSANFGSAGARKKSSSAGGANVAWPKRSQSRGSDEEGALFGVSRAPGSRSAVALLASSQRTVPGARRPGKDTLTGMVKADTSNDNQTTTSPDALINSRKRALSSSQSSKSIGHDDLPMHPIAADSEPPSHMALLPPSPPPEAKSTNTKYKSATSKSSHAQSSFNGKGKLGARAPSRNSKKRRLVEGADLASGDDAASDAEAGDSDFSDSEGVVSNVKVYDWGATRRSARGEDSDFDPEFDFALSNRPLRVNPPLEEDGSTEEERFEVNLPDDLQRILSLSPLRAARMMGEDGEGRVKSVKSKRDLEAEALARAVVTGARAGHYDATKGGEIWDVGEVSSEGGEDTLGLKAEKERAADSEDDDWEGEGLPWEAGEL